MVWHFNGTDVIEAVVGTDPPWTAFGVSVSLNDTVGPNGDTDAHTIEKIETAGSRHYRADNIFSAGNIYTAYLWARAGTSDQLSLGILDSDGWDITSVDVIEGPGTTSITSWANVFGLSTTEWSLIRVVHGLLDGNNRDFYIYPDLVGSATIGKNIKIWKPRVVIGSGETGDWVSVTNNTWLGIPQAPTSIDEPRIKTKPDSQTATHQQGVIVANDRIIVANTDVDGSECGVQILNREAPYAEIIENRTILADIDTFVGSAQGYTHIGSGVIVGEYLYYPVSDRPTLSKWAIVKLSFIDLSVAAVQAITLTATSGTDPDAAGLTYDPDTKQFYLVTFDTTNDLYVIAGEGHDTETFGDIIAKQTTDVSVSGAQGVAIVLNQNGQKRLWVVRASTSVDQPILRLNGTGDGTWMLGTDTLIDTNMGSIWIDAEGLLWYTRSTTLGLGVLGPAYSPYKPDKVAAPDLTHASLVDTKLWWPMTERAGTNVEEVMAGVTTTITNQAAGDGSWATDGIARLEFNGNDGDAFAAGDAGLLGSADTGGDLEAGMTIEAIITPTAVSGKNKGYFNLRDTANADSGDRISLVSSRSAVSSSHVWYDDSSWKDSGYDLLANQTYHVVYVLAAAHIKVYINGFLVASLAGAALPDVTGFFNIGRTRPTSNESLQEQFEGDVIMIRVHANADPDPALIRSWAADPFAAIIPAKRVRALYGPVHRKGRAHHWIEY